VLEITTLSCLFSWAQGTTPGGKGREMEHLGVHGARQASRPLSGNRPQRFVSVLCLV
jgi:hypothetical protein